MAAEELQNIAANQGDIGNISLTINYGEIEKINEERRKLVSFTNGIHYEVEELVDNPFCTTISEMVSGAYELNPSDIKVKAGKEFIFDKIEALSDLVVSTVTDEGLKEDLEKKVEGLDKDEVSADLKEVMKEAAFWEIEFIKAEKCREIAEEIFTPDVRANWTTISEDERKQIIEDYVQRIGRNFYEHRRNWWDKLWDLKPSNVNIVKYDALGFGYSEKNGAIGIKSDFITNPTKNHSVDKVIDTVTHEVRHQYQYDVYKNPGKFDAPETIIDGWNPDNYVSSTPPPPKTYTDYYQQEKEKDARAFAAISRPEVTEINEIK